jgi:hypothetical protein
MTDEREGADVGRHMATEHRRTLDAIFHHPVPHNLSWMDALRLLTHLGSADERADGKYSLTINGKHLVFHKPHGKDLDARQITDLRHYFALSGISPENPYGTPPIAEPTSVDVVALIDHHGAKLYRIHLLRISAPKQSLLTIRIIFYITCTTATKCVNMANARLKI